jgi:CHRD domain
MSNFRSKIALVCLVASLIAAVSIVPISSYAQKQTNFVATLSGKNVLLPTGAGAPVDTPATGTAKFHLNPNGTMSYEVDVHNVAGVIGVPIRIMKGSHAGVDLAQLFNTYRTVNGKAYTQSSSFSALINGQLSSGELTRARLLGPLLGQNVSGLVPFFANKTADVIVRTQAHQMGEIAGQILPVGMSA